MTADINITLFAPGGSLANLFLDPTSDGRARCRRLEYDLTSVFRHELAHGLGFIGFTNPNTGVASNDVMMFDHYISKEGAQQRHDPVGQFHRSECRGRVCRADRRRVAHAGAADHPADGEALFHVANALSGTRPRVPTC